MHLNQSWPYADPAQAFDWQSATDCNVVRLHLRDWVWGRGPGGWWWRLRRDITSQDATYPERSRQSSLSGTEEIQKPMHRRGDIVTQERWRHDSGEMTAWLRTLNHATMLCGRTTRGWHPPDSCFKALLQYPGLETPSNMVSPGGNGLLKPRHNRQREPGEELAKLSSSLRRLPWAGVGRLISHDKLSVFKTW